MKMTDKDWDDIPYADGDCIRDEDEWNDMIDYIRHSSCTDFTIYSTCPLTGQAFRFTQDDTDSQMFGGDDTGDDLHIWGNDNATSVGIALLNTGEFQIWDGADEMLRVTYAANVTTIGGGAFASDDLVLKSNSVNVYPRITLEGALNIEYQCANGFAHNFYEDGGHFLSLYDDGTDDVIEGKTVGNDLYLKPVGLLKWGTEQTNAGSDRGELIPMKTAAGVTVYLKTYDLV
jgi:hypothetical protein